MAAAHKFKMSVFPAFGSRTSCLVTGHEVRFAPDSDRYQKSCEVSDGPWLCQNAFPERAHFGEAAMRAISGFD